MSDALQQALSCTVGETNSHAIVRIAIVTHAQNIVQKINLLD